MALKKIQIHKILNRSVKQGGYKILILSHRKDMLINSLIKKNCVEHKSVESTMDYLHIDLSRKRDIQK